MVTKMTGQTTTVLRHLHHRGSISPMEALITYGIMRLAARIYDLRLMGHNIVTHIKQDEGGHRYARYDYQPEGRDSEVRQP